MSVQSDDKCFIGAEAKSAIDAERSAVFWMLAWCLSLPKGSEVVIHVDNQAACYGASGAWKTDLGNELAVRIRELAAFVATRCKLVFEHVKAHSLHPLNELADVLAGQVAEDTRCIPHRISTNDCRVAAFRNYKMLWFWHQQGRALPILTEDGYVADSHLDEPKVVPCLVRAKPDEEEAAEDQAVLNVCVATYNVLTLKPFDKATDMDADSAFFGKAAYLHKQMCDCDLNVLAIQEGRSKDAGLFENANVLRIVAAGTQAGTHGVELWLNKCKAFGQIGKMKLYFDRAKITVRLATPTLLVVCYSLGKKRLIFVVCHAPQTGQTEDVRAEWWKMLNETVGCIGTDETLFVLGDFNARLPHSLQPHVGDLVCSKSNRNTPFLVDFLQKNLLWAPSTFSSLHQGPIETWQHSSGQLSRLDYVLIRQDQWNCIASSAWPRLDAGNAIVDHFAVALRVRTEWKGKMRRKTEKSIDWSQVRDPQNQMLLCEILNEIPVSPWNCHPTDQVQALTHDIQERLRANFPLKGARFRKPYVTDEVWKLRQRRCNLRALLRALNRSNGRDKSSLWFGFRRLKSARCLSTQPVIVIPHLVASFCVPLLRDTARALKNAIRLERASFVEKISLKANHSNMGQIFADLKKLGVRSKNRRRGTPPLPMWNDSQGHVAEDQAERAAIWRERCSDLEAGQIMTPQQLLSRAESKRPPRTHSLKPPSVHELPSLTQIEGKLRTVKKNKAPGNDQLRSELCAIGAVPLAKHLHALATKFVTFLEEPLQWKGGLLVAAYKNAGRMDDVKSYRSLLLSDHLGKSMRSWLRERFRNIYSTNSADTHFAGKLGGNPSHASSLARAFLSGMGRRGISCSAYFVDVSSAYYRVVRELVVGMQTTDQEVIAILERFGLGPKEFHALREHLCTEPILAQYDVDDRDAAMLESLLECTWFTVGESSIVTRTRAGSRPGDTFADLVFAYVYSHLLKVLREALEGEGLVTPDSISSAQDLRSCHCQDVDMRNAPSIVDVTWADDLVVLQAHEDCRELIRRTTLAGGLLSDLCTRRGLQLNYKSGKTECLLRLKGKGTRALRMELFASEEPRLRLPSTIYEVLFVRIVAHYKHLGTQITMASSQMHELRVRTGQAKAIYHKHRKNVFQNPLIALPVRVKLLNVLVLSVLTYNQGTWRTLNTREWAYYQNVIMYLYRGLARATIPHDDLQEWSHERVLAMLEVASPQALLHASRLRYLGAMWRGAPDIVWWMHHMEKSWFEALAPAIEWLNHHTAGLQDREAAKKREATWQQIIPQAQAWKYYIKKATQHDIATSKADELKHRWHFEFVEKLIEKGLEVQHSDLLIAGLYEDGLPKRHRFGCLPCDMTFATKSGWSVHAFKKHGRVAPERHAIQGSVCLPCNKQFHTTQRLLRHLRYNQACAATMMEIEMENTEILPGLGNQKLDQDRTFPLPVIKLPGPVQPLPAANQICRPETSAVLLKELVNCVIEAAPEDVLTCVGNCMQKVRQSLECSDVVIKTVDAFVLYFQDSEEICLDVLAKAQLGGKVSMQLQKQTTFEKLFPEQRHEASPAAMRGATYRAVQKQAGRRRQWQPLKTVLRMRSRTLIVAHFFSGHRRHGDLTGFLDDLPSPSGATIVAIPIDIIFDSFRCDLARKEIQVRWKAIASVGSLLGFIAGPPCETFSVARSQGGRAGETKGDGGPRQLRSFQHPYGLPCMTEDERKHTHLGNGLLWLTYDLCAELLPYDEAFFVLEHPAPPHDAEAKDLPSSWKTGACELLLTHPEVFALDLWQGKFGAKSPKPTRFLCKGVPTLEKRLTEYGNLPMPPPLQMKKVNGMYSTAELKAYPERLCKALSQAARDSLLAYKDHAPPCTLVDARTEEWIDNIVMNTNSVVSMGMDRAGFCDL